MWFQSKTEINKSISYATSAQTARGKMTAHWSSCYEVFTKNLFDSGILLKREFKNYKRLYNTILEYVKVPDLLIYIRNKNINNIVNNIKKRNRKFEKKINTEYLKNLNNYYENWIKHYSNKNLLIIDITNKDFIKNSKDLKNIYNIIETKINELT